MHFSFSLFCRKLRQPKNSRQYLNIAKKSSARVASARVFREPLTGGEFQSPPLVWRTLQTFSLCCALWNVIPGSSSSVGCGWRGLTHVCACACARARACVCVCVCVCLFRSVVGTCNTVATRLQPEHHSRCRYILDQWLRIKSQRTIRSVPLSSSYTKQVLFSEPPSCAWLGETQEPALETTVSSSHQPNGDHGDAAHHSQVFGRTPVTMTTRPLPFSLYVVIGKARACPDQSRWPSSGSTQITTSWTTTALASVELVSKSDLSPNSKHWFKTSFLQSLPYLVTS